ncbi:hypothetical protein 049ML003_10 [Bacillus phage 049ML003]|nr:hypothetical protein 049ML003_10 [Bacillus phage 049ML003]
MSVIPAKKRALARKRAEEEAKKAAEVEAKEVERVEDVPEKPQEAAEDPKKDTKGKNTKKPPKKK